MLRDLPTPTSGSFTASSVVKEGWSRLAGSKRYYLLLAASVWLIERATSFVAVAIWPHTPDAADRIASVSAAAWRLPSASLTIDMFPVMTVEAGLVPVLLTALVTTLFTGAFAAFALRRAAGLDVDHGLIFRYTRYYSVFLVLYVLGFALAWVTAATMPLLLLAFAAVNAVLASFVPLFIVDRDMGPVQAVVSAYRLVRHNLGQSLLLLLLALAASLLTSATYGIAGIWLSPLIAIAYAVAFRRAVGIHTAGEALPVVARPVLESRV